MIIDGELSSSMPSPDRLSVTVTFQRMTFKKCFVDHTWSRRDLLTSKSTKFIFVPNEAVNLVKFPRTARKLSCTPSVCDHIHTDSSKTECLSRLIAGEGIKRPEERNVDIKFQRR